MGTKKIVLLVTSALMAVPFAANAALVAANGGALVVDSTNNLTWVSNGNLFGTQAAASGNAAAFVSAIIGDSGGVIHDTPSLIDPSGTHALSAIDFNTTYGTMSWWGAQAWVNYLDATSYQGYTNWRLPTTVDNNSSAAFPPATSSSEMSELYYGQLGQTPGVSITVSHNSSYALFSNLQNVAQGNHWSQTEWSSNFSYVWGFGDGGQGNYAKNGNAYALVVRSGVVSPVPLPAAVWLTLSGLGGLGALARKKRAA